MARKIAKDLAPRHYLNGDEVQLVGRRCDSCDPARIQGVLCHEAGCPQAWRDESIECGQCGEEFYPAERGLNYCPGCVEHCCPEDE